MADSRYVSSRLAVAQRLAGRYAGDALGVLCGGSTSRGQADRWSDLELLVLWPDHPDEQTRRRICEQENAAHPRFFGYDADEGCSMDDYWIGDAGTGLLVEVGHFTAADADRLLEDLLVRAAPEPHLLTFASALASGVPLAGDLSRYTDRVASYPRPLAAAVARRLGQIDHFWRWQMYLERQNPYGLAVHFAGVVTAIGHQLCAVNRRFWPGPKWPPGGFAIEPPGLRERLAEAATAPTDRAAAQLSSLVEQCYDLVEAHLPEVDVARLREIFRFARNPWP